MTFLLGSNTLPTRLARKSNTLVTHREQLKCTSIWLSSRRVSWEITLFNSLVWVQWLGSQPNIHH
jgi:hypothetical protein